MARIVRLSVHTYRRMLRLYPSSFRREYGPQMVQAFRTACREVHKRRGGRGVIGLWPAALADLIVNALAERGSELVGASMRGAHGRQHLSVTRIVVLGLGMAVVGVLVVTSTVSAPATPTGDQTGAPADPTEAGPYAVGVTRRALTYSSTTDGPSRTVDTVIWYPGSMTAASLPPDVPLDATVNAEPERADGPHPVIMFPHSRLQGPRILGYLLTHLASHGFVVVTAPSQESWLSRPDEMVAVLDRVLMLSTDGDPLFETLLDARRLGVIGVGFGADTALRAAMSTARLRAAVAMAPTASSRATAAAPVSGALMLMGGVLDDQSPFMYQQMLWDGLPLTGPEHRFVVFARGGHGAFGTRCPSTWAGCSPSDLPQDQSHAVIKHWTTAFLLEHVRLDGRYAAFLDPTLTLANPEVDVSIKP